MLTLQQFTQIFGTVKEAQAIVNALNEQMPRYNINTHDRVCAFLAQLGHESGYFVHRVENLNYSASGLRKIFARHFPTDAIAQQYARQPIRIASRVYANRMGNGDEASQDGWKFRGRGYIQLTGRNNYTACGRYLGRDLVADPDYLMSIEGAVVSAGWFWEVNKLNVFADARDMKTLTRRINGGFNGLAHRMELYTAAQQILPVNMSAAPALTPVIVPPTEPTTQQTRRVLRQGARGQDVAEMQRVLGIDADGVFGPATDRALREWQRANNLTADGIAGPRTFRAMFG